jgi:hypothetical protein
MPFRWWEKQIDGRLIELELIGEKVDDDSPLIKLLVSKADQTTPQTPRAPDLAATQLSQSTAILTWAEVLFPGPPITSWEVQRQDSADDGVSFSSWAPISGSPFNSTVLTKTDTLTTGSPQIVFNYRARAINADGPGEWSIIFGIQWQGTVLNPPNRPTGLIISEIQSTSVRLSWTEPAGTATDEADQYGIYQGNTLLLGNINPSLLTYVWSGLTENTLYSNINVRRHNSAGWSSGSNWVDFTTTQGGGTFTFNPLIGCSNSTNTHGGTDDWDAWRVYGFDSGTDGGALSIANRTGATHPKVLCVTDSGISSSRGALYSNYQDAFDNWSAWLEEFYYTTGTATQIATRQDVELHIANGNEYAADIGSASELTGFVQGCRGIYDATRLTHNQVTGSGGNGRRYPLASSWVDPTHDQEGRSLGSSSTIPFTIEESLYPAVPYLDGVGWSMYPPGRADTEASPTLDWPSFDYDLPRNSALTNNERNRRGYLSRCFRRTYEAQQPATNPNITSFHKLKISTWETGTGDFPLSQSIRPYFAVHGMLASMGVMAKHYNLEMAVMLWWDNQTDSAAPQNILTDEPTPGAGQISTRVALQNWKTYNHFEGDSHPADWPTDPPNTWPNRDNTWKNTWVTDMNAAWPL